VEAPPSGAAVPEEGENAAMGTWMKTIWALAAVAVLACLVALARTPGGGSPAAAVSSTPEYFTQSDPARSTIQYGVRENGQTVIYSTGLKR
jgi:hypothetical protein